MSRKFELVLWGASGFTGKLVAEYLVKHYSKDALSWAIAGRNQKKLEALRDELTKIDGSASELPILLGDSHDKKSLKAIAAASKVVCSTVGPYGKYGSELVAACVEESTHYCDLTGEVHWARQMIDSHFEKAKENKTKIVHCCGYDSIPSDLGVLIVQNEMHRLHGVYCDEIKFFAGPSKGGLSGGTIDSMITTMKQAKDKKIRKVLANPYSLHPEGAEKGPRVRDQMNVRWDEDYQTWTGPFIMASVNTRVVRRSQAILDQGESKKFMYTEVMSFGKGAKGWMRAHTFAAGLTAFGLLMLLSPTRALLQKTVLPAPGEGPSKESRENGFFTSYFLGKSGDKKVYGMVTGEKDPGYAGTAIMLAESALCLAKDTSQLPDEFGVLTPATAMGEVLVERLRKTEMTFKVSEEQLYRSRRS